MTHQPEIEPRTAAALCADEYTGMPAIDDDTWQGANDSARSTVWGDWCFCYDDETRSVRAINADSEVFYSYRMGPWEQQ